jgi:predicted DNA-binding protein
MRGLMQGTVATSIRLRPDIRERILEMAREEANTESAVLRRIIHAGMRVLEDDQKAPGSPDPVAAA